MMKCRRFLLLLVAAVLLTQSLFCGGGLVSLNSDYTHWDDMVYVRPDVDAMQGMVDHIGLTSQTGTTAEILKEVLDFYDAYDWFDTCYVLSDIHCSADLDDPYWQEEYSFCMSAAAEVDRMLEEMNVHLAASPKRKQLERRFFGTGFLDDYDGEGTYDETLLELMSRESELISQYYTQSAEREEGLWSFFSFKTEDDMAQTLVDLIRVRRQIASYLGYDSYEAYANDLFYYRDYTPEQMDAYLEAIRTELVPMYADIWELAADLPDYTEAATFAYVRNAAQKMGGTIWDAFCLMEKAGLYDISYSDSKYGSSFEMYLTSYAEPYVFMCPEGTQRDCLTFAHEFGHFCEDYDERSAESSVDVSEIFSQAMEYLSLFYAEDTKALARAKLADSLCTYVEQAMYASFERDMYCIPDAELSVQALYDLYERTALAFGMDSIGFDVDEFTALTHYYTNPMYIVSYIVSNDAAMQFYAMELAEPGSGLKCLNENLGNSEAYFLAFLEKAGLESPFAPGRFDRVKAEFEAAFAG